jgi:phosphoserine aminotransferase
MTPPTDALQLPADLRPTDGRFGCGPSKVRPDAVAKLADASSSFLGTSHRQPRVKDVVGRVRAGLRELYQLPDGYEVVLGNGGATLFWDAAAACLVDERSLHYVCGEFSQKFAEVTAGAPFLGDPVVVSSDPGSHPAPVSGDQGVDAYALIQNETSTGVAAPVRRPDGDAGALVLVDATSAAGGMRVDPAAFDAYYFSPQKAFGSEGGLWLALCSPAAIERIERRTASAQRWIPATLDLAQALTNSRADQTLNTPALSTLFLMAEQIDWMLAHGGLEWAAARCEASSGHVYGWAEQASYASPFVTDPALRSPVVATIDLEGVDAGAVSKALRANGIVDTESYRKLGRNQLRLGVFPSVEPDDVAILTAAIDYLVERLAE